MAAAATSSPKQEFFQEDNNPSTSNERNNHKYELQSAIAKAMELRALHAALMQQKQQQQQGNNNCNSPSAHLKFPSASPSAHHNPPHFSSQDYPVFTPSYEDEPLPAGYPNFPDNCHEYGLGGGLHGDESNASKNGNGNANANASSRKGFPSDLVNLGTNIYPASEDQRSLTSSFTNHPTLLSASPGPDFCKSRRSSLGEFRSVSSYNNRCNPPSIGSDFLTKKTVKNSNLVVPLTDLHSSAVHSQPKTRGMSFLRLFPRLKKKNKHVDSPNHTEPDEASQGFKEFGVLSIEALKRELLDANEKRDMALTEVAEMKSSIGELSKKLEYLENYCEDLKKALTQAMQVKNSHQHHHLEKLGESVMPVSEEVMIEGFLQMVSEARLSVKQFCKTLVEQIEETDNSLMDSLNLLLLPYRLSLHPKFSKSVLYHLEAIMNQSLYQDFENCVFQKNGTPKLLDPQQDREAKFTSFVALRNLSWNEVLRKGTKYYSEEFSKFCDQKMSCIIAAMNWTRPWPEQLLQAFFVAAKCIWLLHLLAFSFNPPIGILRVDENRSFDPHFMEDVGIEKQKMQQNSSRVKIMVLPGFYVHDRVLRCKVLCRYKSVK